MSLVTAKDLEKLGKLAKQELHSKFERKESLREVRLKLCVAAAGGKLLFDRALEAKTCFSLPFGLPFGLPAACLPYIAPPVGVILPRRRIEAQGSHRYNRDDPIFPICLPACPPTCLTDIPPPHVVRTQQRTRLVSKKEKMKKKKRLDQHTLALSRISPILQWYTEARLIDEVAAIKAADSPLQSVQEEEEEEGEGRSEASVCRSSPGSHQGAAGAGGELTSPSSPRRSVDDRRASIMLVSSEMSSTRRSSSFFHGSGTEEGTCQSVCPCLYFSLYLSFCAALGGSAGCVGTNQCNPWQIAIWSQVTPRKRRLLTGMFAKSSLKM